MPLVFVTGLSGSGKSAVLRELQRRGHDAHGVDEEGYADWVDRESGLVTPFPHDDPALDLHAWYRRHRWVLSAARIGDLRARAEGPVFLAGMAEDDGAVWHLFDKVVALRADEATLRHRIETRQDNTFGKDPGELALILEWLEKYDETYRNLGATLIDTSRPLSQVVDDVVAAALS
jgi:hypothetical protein